MKRDLIKGIIKENIKKINNLSDIQELLNFKVLEIEIYNVIKEDFIQKKDNSFDIFKLEKMILNKNRFECKNEEKVKEIKRKINKYFQKEYK